MNEHTYPGNSKDRAYMANMAYTTVGNVARHLREAGATQRSLSDDEGQLRDSPGKFKKFVAEMGGQDDTTPSTVLQCA